MGYIVGTQHLGLDGVVGTLDGVYSGNPAPRARLGSGNPAPRARWGSGNPAPRASGNPAIKGVY